MAPSIFPVATTAKIPNETTVVVIGGGIVGLMTALTLIERGIPVTVLEKGCVAGEQSSRNLGWIRTMGRGVEDLPLAIKASELWPGLAARVGADVGFRRAGVMYLARNDDELARHAAWLERVRDFELDSRLLSPADIDQLLPGGKAKWAGGIVTPSDARAEPTLAASAVANAAVAKGAIIVDQCAVRTVSRTGGRVTGVVTEQGEIRCDQVVLAGGIWSRRFLGNLGVPLLTLPLVASVVRTAPLDGPTDMAVGGPDFSFRKRIDGGYTITQRGAFIAPLVPDSLRIGRHFMSMLRAEWKSVRLAFGRDFLREAGLARQWGNEVSPFERVRTMDPPVNAALNTEALENLSAAWPVFKRATIAESWAGMIDVTPDSLPVISPVSGIPGLTIATGFSGHGFGTSVAAGRLAADIATAAEPIVDPAPYRLERQGVHP